MLMHAMTVALGLALSAATGAAVAADASRPPRLAAAEANQISLDEAVTRVEKQYGARAVKAEARERKGRRVYRIRLLSPDGRVFDVEVDAATGRVE